MRKHLVQDFTKICHIDLKGNARTAGERRQKEGGNIFDDQIRVGVGISFFIKKAGVHSEKSEVWIYSVDDYLKARKKREILAEFGACPNLPLKQAAIDAKHTWLTEGYHAEYETFIPMGTKEAKMAKGGDSKVMFNLYSLGVATNRDILAFSFDLDLLQDRVRTFIEIYNSTVDRKRRLDPNAPPEDFVDTNDPRIKWTRQVKASLRKLAISKYEESHFRTSLYRPFCQKHLYFDNFWNEERYQQHLIFPTLETHTENRVVVVSDHGFRAGFSTLMTNLIPELHTIAASDGFQCFPFYTYDEDGSNRRENITDWSLAQFRARYGDDTIRQVGHLPLRLRPPAPPRLPRTLPGQPQAGAAAHSRSRPTSAPSPRPAPASRRSTSAMKGSPNIRLRQVETPDMRSTGASKRCASPKTRRNCATTAS